MSIDAIWSAGYEGTQILTRDNPQEVRFVGQDCVDFRNLVCQRFVQHIQIEHIPLGQLFQISEHLLTCHAAVAGENGVGIFAAHWQGASQ